MWVGESAVFLLVPASVMWHDGGMGVRRLRVVPMPDEVREAFAHAASVASHPCFGEPDGELVGAVVARTFRVLDGGGESTGPWRRVLRVVR